MRYDKRKILASTLLLSVLLICPASIVAAEASSATTANTAGMKAQLPLIAYYYGSKLSAPQPSPYCLIFGGTTAIICYTPQDLKAAYNYPNYLNGAGQTIVIVDAFGSPTVQSDLNTFDSLFGLPPTTIQIVCQGGTCPSGVPSNADQLSWTEEIALDTQYAHAMAPGAHIVLYVTQSDDDLVIEQGVLAAVKMFPHSIISQSFGDPEQDLKAGSCTSSEPAPAPVCSPAYVQQVLSTGELAYKLAAQEGTTVFASAGDYGADNSGLCPTCYGIASPSYPSSSPWVTAVGGTQGNPYIFNTTASCKGFICSTGLVSFLNNPACELNTLTPTTTPSCTPVGYGGEAVWNEASENTFFAATGGAPSLYFSVPFYQLGLGLSARATPDVSYNSAIDGGVFGYWTAGESLGVPGGLYIFGGTSAGSPQWSAIAALADQLAAQEHKGTIGFINPTLYYIGHTPWLYSKDFHDITVGNNNIDGTVGFSATKGWDDASGWGTPNVSNLIQDLAQFSSNLNFNFP